MTNCTKEPLFTCTNAASTRPRSIFEDPEDFAAAPYVISYTKGRRSARLHRAMGCWRARSLRFGDYEFEDRDPPPQDTCDVLCIKCFEGEGAEDISEGE